MTESSGFTPFVYDNKAWEAYYTKQCIWSAEDFAKTKLALETKLPCSFRLNTVFKGNELLKAKILKELSDVQSTPLHFLNSFGLQIDELDRRDIKRKENLQSLKTLFMIHEMAGPLNRQETVSMLPVCFLDVQADSIVFDLCASPGSKTCQLLDLVTNGLVVSNDIDWKRAKMLSHQVDRLGSPASVVTNADATFFPNFCSPDRVLCDVPCTSDGTMRKTPNIWRKWRISDAYDIFSRQLAILERGYRLLKEGGLLVYSTCSLNPIENECVIANALARNMDTLEVLNMSDFASANRISFSQGVTNWTVFDYVTGNPISDSSAIPETCPKVKPAFFKDHLFLGLDDNSKKNIEEALQSCMRFSPHLMNTGGFFVCVIRKKMNSGSDTNTNDTEAATGPTLPSTHDFLTIDDKQQILRFFGIDLDAFPNLIFLKVGKKIYASSRHAADVLDSRFVRKGGLKRLVSCGTRVFVPAGKQKDQIKFSSYRITTEGVMLFFDRANIYGLNISCKRQLILHSSLYMELLLSSKIELTTLQLPRHFRTDDGELITGSVIVSREDKEGKYDSNHVNMPINLPCCNSHDVHNKGNEKSLYRVLSVIDSFVKRVSPLFDEVSRKAYIYNCVVKDYVSYKSIQNNDTVSPAVVQDTNNPTERVHSTIVRKNFSSQKLNIPTRHNLPTDTLFYNDAITSPDITLSPTELIRQLHDSQVSGDFGTHSLSSNVRSFLLRIGSSTNVSMGFTSSFSRSNGLVNSPLENPYTQLHNRYSSGSRPVSRDLPSLTNLSLNTPVADSNSCSIQRLKSKETALFSIFSDDAKAYEYYDVTPLVNETLDGVHNIHRTSTIEEFRDFLLDDDIDSIFPTNALLTNPEKHMRDSSSAKRPLSFFRTNLVLHRLIGNTSNITISRNNSVCSDPIRYKDEEIGPILSYTKNLSDNLLAFFKYSPLSENKRRRISRSEQACLNQLASIERYFDKAYTTDECSPLGPLSRNALETMRELYEDLSEDEIDEMA